MKIINKMPEMCFSHGENLFIRDDFWGERRNISCGELGTFLTIASLCNKENYTTLKELMKHCKEPEQEILDCVNTLAENNYIDVEE